MHIGKWFHHLFNPHCAECKLDLSESKICSNCESLKVLLEQERYEKNQILQQLLAMNKPVVPQTIIPQEQPKPIHRNVESWKERKKILEAEDRKAAQVLRDNSRTIAEIEKGLELPEVKEANANQ